MKKYILLLMSAMLFGTTAGIQYTRVPRPHDRYAPEGLVNTLSKKLESQSIYYGYTDQKSGWSCGYHALYAACKLEQRFGKKNPFHNFKKFETTVKKRLRKKKWKKPTDDSTTAYLLDDLAHVLKLEEFFYLDLGEQTRKIHLVMPEEVTYSYPVGASDELKQERLAEKLAIRDAATLKQLKTSLKKRPRKHCIHFVCHVVIDKEDHCFLATVTQHHPKKRSLYIYDNCNTEIEPGSIMAAYLELLKDEFKIK